MSILSPTCLFSSRCPVETSRGLGSVSATLNPKASLLNVFSLLWFGLLAEILKSVGRYSEARIQSLTCSGFGALLAVNVKT